MYLLMKICPFNVGRIRIFLGIMGIVYDNNRQILRIVKKNNGQEKRNNYFVNPMSLTRGLLATPLTVSK